MIRNARLRASQPASQPASQLASCRQQFRASRLFIVASATNTRVMTNTEIRTSYNYNYNSSYNNNSNFVVVAAATMVALLRLARLGGPSKESERVRADLSG